MPRASRYHPDTIARLFAGDIAHPALLAHLTALRHDPDWRVVVAASATRCDVDLLHWPTGARSHVRLETAGPEVDLPWRRAA